jgi:uncharacterized protein
MTAGDRVYLDTSGVIAFFNASDEFHALAVRAMRTALSVGHGFIMTDYVRLECWTLVHRRLGMDALADFCSQLLPLCIVSVVGDEGFRRLAHQSLLLQRKSLSLVDLSSFECMRAHGLKRALAFDRHFTEQGFITPESANW